MEGVEDAAGAGDDAFAGGADGCGVVNRRTRAACRCRRTRPRRADQGQRINERAIVRLAVAHETNRSALRAPSIIGISRPMLVVIGADGHSIRGVPLLPRTLRMRQ